MGIEFLAAAPFLAMGIVCVCVFIGSACYAVVDAIRLYRYDKREEKQSEIMDRVKREISH